ncbi:MAG: hypothetical protein MPJ22_12945, partial [Pirellulales bacterium]|nr:hypothetical protein [Pirellulales bacterium]
MAGRVLSWAGRKIRGKKRLGKVEIGGAQMAILARKGVKAGAESMWEHPFLSFLNTSWPTNKQ